MLLFAIIAASQAAQAQPTEQSSRRDQARALAASGKLQEALSIYDGLTARGSKDPTLYAEARHAARDAHDMKRIAIYAERQIAIDPDDFGTRQLIAMAYRVAGDEANAQRSVAEFTSYWKASKDPQIRSKPFLLIDSFRAGTFTVNVIQCLELGGDFGVGYIFDVWGPKALPLPPEELAANHRARIVLEHNRIDQRIKSELTHTDAPVTPTLDALDGAGHKTLQWFKDEPAYAVIRGMVERYVANDKGLAARTPMKSSWTRITCQPASVSGDLIPRQKP
jgi:hypothetical protein